MPVPPASSRRTAIVTIVAAMVVASIAPPLVSAGTSQDPEIDDGCLDSGLGPLSAVPQTISDIAKAWWSFDPVSATLELHVELCSDLPAADARRAAEQIFWSAEWTDPDGDPWKANFWLEGTGEPGDEGFALCENNVDIDGVGKVRREAGNTTHWIVEIANDAAATGFEGELTEFRIFAGQYRQFTGCDMTFLTLHDRAPDSGFGDPYDVPDASLPNLAVDALTTDPDVPSSGDPIVANATVVNRAQVPTDPTTARFLVDGSSIGEVDVPGLAAGESVTVSSPTWSGDDGDHTVRAVVDPGDTVDESNETDNDREIPVRIGWPTLDNASIRPGVKLETDAGQCTASFIFSTPDNETLFIATASHCVGGLSLGDPVTIASRANAGVVAYCSWMHTEGSEICPSTPLLVLHPNDFALIEIKDTYRDQVHPAMRVFGGPTGLAHSVGFGDPVLTYGNTDLRPGGQLDPREGYAVGQSTWSTQTIELPPSVQGDSGSPLVTDDGRALGVLSGGSATNSWVRVDQAVDYAESRTDLDVELKTFRMLEEGLLPPL